MPSRRISMINGSVGLLYQSDGWAEFQKSVYEECGVHVLHRIKAGQAKKRAEPQISSAERGEREKGVARGWLSCGINAGPEQADRVVNLKQVETVTFGRSELQKES